MSVAEQKGFTPLILSPRWYSPARLGCKRGIDLIGSVILLLLISPLMLVLAALVKLTSPGPVFYRWRVVGKEGRPFIGYKFRSMISNADDLKTGLLAQNEMVGPVF